MIHQFTGKLQVRVEASLPANFLYESGPWLIRVQPNSVATQGVFAVEAVLDKVYKNTGKFLYGKGRSLALPLTSDRILALLKRSTGSISTINITDIKPSQVKYWNMYADFRTWEYSSYAFEGVPLEAVKVYDVREGSGYEPIFYPLHPRFRSDEIVLTRYEAVPADNVPGIEYGYARVERVALKSENVGLCKLPIVTYTIRRSWKGISMEDWNRFSKIKDYVQGERKSMSKLPESMQSDLRYQLFDPFYR